MPKLFFKELIGMGETVYSSKEIAKLLGVKDSTVRKYCLAFEEQGYKFHKNEFGYRGFFEKDVMLLRRLMDLKNDPDMTTARAIKAILSSFETESGTGVVTDVELVNMTGKGSLQSHDNLEVLKEFKEFQKRQEEFNQALIERIEQRDKNLMMVLRELQETRKEIATAKQEKKWWQFWK